MSTYRQRDKGEIFLLLTRPDAFWSDIGVGGRLCLLAGSALVTR